MQHIILWTTGPWTNTIGSDCLPQSGTFTGHILYAELRDFLNGDYYFFIESSPQLCWGRTGWCWDRPRRSFRPGKKSKKIRKRRKKFLGSIQSDDNEKNAHFSNIVSHTLVYFMLPTDRRFTSRRRSQDTWKTQTNENTATGYSWYNANQWEHNKRIYSSWYNADQWEHNNRLQLM